MKNFINFIRKELNDIKGNQVDLHGGCVACHMIFRLKENLDSSEQNAADLLSEVLTGDPVLNREFIDVVEKIHMNDRHLGGSFALRERESKDNYLEAYFSNVLDELTFDLITSSHKIILRNLLSYLFALYSQRPGNSPQLEWFNISNFGLPLSSLT